VLQAALGRLSDQQLADRLRDAGYPMARRTVAKHRARLGFIAARAALSGRRGGLAPFLQFS
jgi:RNA polymerase sigma-54 factor